MASSFDQPSTGVGVAVGSPAWIKLLNGTKDPVVKAPVKPKPKAPGVTLRINAADIERNQAALSRFGFSAFTTDRAGRRDQAGASTNVATRGVTLNGTYVKPKPGGLATKGMTAIKPLTVGLLQPL